MQVTKSIRNKLFLLLLIMGALPFLIVIVFNAREMVHDLEEEARRDGLLRNSVISEHLTNLVKHNFNMMNELALNPMIIQYLDNPSEEMRRPVINLLHDTNTIIHDRNMAALTAPDGMQLLRTDGSKLVNISDRKHFQEAMQNRAYVSDVLISRSTGERIIVMEVPVKDRWNRPIGMLQRNFDLSGLHNFIGDYDTDDIKVLVIDRQGQTIAHSGGNRNFEGEFYEDARYKYLADVATDDSGMLRLKVDGRDSLASYSLNFITDWIVVTVQPYDEISDRVYDKMFDLAIIGLVMLEIVAMSAYYLSVVATDPIIKITNVANKIVKGSKDIEKLEIDSDDEIGQMVEAFNQIRTARDAYRLESELDKLTKLYNKATTENIGKMKLKNFREMDPNDTIMALYIIDLDHFKDANDRYGHQYGDRVLIEFSRQLRKKFRPNDCIGRFGGDEFVVIIDNLPRMEIVLRKARDIKSVASNLELDGKNAGITASVGIAIIPQDGTEYDEVFNTADSALYYVKAHGRNGYYYKGADEIG